MKKPDYKIAILLSLLAFVIYFFFSPKAQANDYFFPQAVSFLHGKIDIAPKPNLNELVESGGKYFVVYPPMPTVVLVPFVILFGNSINQAVVSVIIASLSVGFFFLLASRFTKKTWSSIALTILFGFGTNFFYTALIGSSWYFAHVCAVFFLILALLCVAEKRHPLVIGFFFAAAFMSRLPVFLSFPIFLYFLWDYSKSRSFVRNAIYFFIPIIFAIAIFGCYNLARFGSFMQTGYSLIPGVLQEPWFQYGIFSYKYMPDQLRAILLSVPTLSSSYPYFLPSNISMALWLTTPALLILLLLKLKDKLSWMFLFVALFIFLPSLIHGTVGFTQFGYRYSLDFIVLLLLALIPVFERIGKKITGLFVGLSVLINFWVIWLFYIGLFHT